MNADEGLIKIQELLKKNPTLVVGTGLSIPMGLPGMEELLEYLKDKLPSVCSKEAVLEWEDCLDYIEQYGFEEGLGKYRVSKDLLEKIVMVTSELVEYKDNIFAEKLPTMTIMDFPFAILLEYILKSMPPSNPVVSVITPNYDHLVEYACDIIKVDYFTGFSGGLFQNYSPQLFKERRYKKTRITQRKKSSLSFRQVPLINLYKPHGSISWKRIGEETFQTSINIRDCSRVIITPGMTKYQSSLTDRVMNAHRELANTAINDSSSVIIIGYGFNDDHLQTALVEKMTNGMDSMIITKHMSKKAERLAKEYPNVLAIEQGETEHSSILYIENEKITMQEPLWDLGYFVKKFYKYFR